MSSLNRRTRTWLLVDSGQPARRVFGRALADSWRAGWEPSAMVSERRQGTPEIGLFESIHARQWNKKQSKNKGSIEADERF